MADRPVSSPYKGKKLMEDAWAKGRAAREEGKSLDSCPLGDYPGRQFKRAWEEGWKSIPEEPPVALPVVAKEPGPTAAVSWPAGKPLPTHYPKPQPLPCPKCRMVLLDWGAQAVIVRSTLPAIVYFECRNCEHCFSLPVAEPKS